MLALLIELLRTGDLPELAIGDVSPRSRFRISAAETVARLKLRALRAGLVCCQLLPAGKTLARAASAGARGVRAGCGAHLRAMGTPAEWIVSSNTGEPSNGKSDVRAHSRYCAADRASRPAREAWPPQYSLLQTASASASKARTRGRTSTHSSRPASWTLP